MPIFEANGKKYNVKDEYLDAFAKDYPDAVTYEEREGKIYRVKSKDYNTFRSQFDMPTEPVVTAPIEDNSEFEENQRLFAEGKPTKGVTTQSIIDAHPELGLQPKQYSEDVLQRSRENVPDYFKSKKDMPLVDRPLGTDAPIGSDERLAARVDIAQKNLSDPIVQKGRTEAEVRGLSTDIDNSIKDVEGRIKAQRNMNWRPGMPTTHNDGVNRLFSERARLSSAQRLLEESQEIVNAAHRGDAGFLEDTWKGFKDGLDAEDFTFGLADAATSASILNALKKVENGESISDVEDKLLKAAAINMATQYYFANDLSRGYKAGQTTAESIPFMLEMAINPISGAGKASAKALLKYGLKKFGSKAVNKAVKAGTRLATDALSSVGMAATTGLGGVASGAMDKLANNYNYGVDLDGKLYVDKKENTMGVAEALGRSFATRAIENQSEMIFRAFDGAGALLKGVDKYIPGGVNTFFDAVKNSKVGQLWRGIKNSPIRKEIAEATKVGGIAEEYLEEVYNNFANVALGEMTTEQALDLDNNIDTFLGLAPTQAMFAMLGLGGMAATRYQTRRDIEDLRAVMNERQREALDGLLKMGSTAEIKDVRAFIRNTMADQTLTIAEKRNAIEAAYDVAKQKAVNDIAEAEIEDKVTEENADIDSKTDTSTGMYTEAVALVSNGEGGVVEQSGNIVGYIGGQPIFVPEGMENTEENRIILKPGDLVEGSMVQAPSEEVKASNEEMIRDEAASQAELESRYAPEVLNAQMVQGQPIDTPSEQIIPISPMPEGNGWVVEVYAKDTNNKVAAKPEIKEMTTEEFRDILQAQLDAEQATIKAEQAIVEEQQQVAPQAEETVAEQPTIATEEAAQPVVEEQPKQPTLEDVVATLPKTKNNEIDYKAMTPQQQYQYTSMTESPEVAMEDLQADIEAGKEEILKTQEQLSKARGGQRAELRDKVRQLTAAQAELEAFAESVMPKQEAVAEEVVEETPVAEAAEETVAEEQQPIVAEEQSQKEEEPVVEEAVEVVEESAEPAQEEVSSWPLSEKEYADKRSQELVEQNPTIDETDAYNQALDEYPSYIGEMVQNGKLEDLYAKSSIKDRIKLGKIVQSAGYETSDISKKSLNQEADNKHSKGESVVISYLDGSLVEGVVEKAENGKVSVRSSKTGRVYNVPESRIVDKSTLDEDTVLFREPEGIFDMAERIANEEARRQPLRDRIQQWEEAGIKVNVIENVEDIPNKAAARAVRSGKIVPGWYEESTDQVFIFLPHINDKNDLDLTIIHEAVAHHGMRGLLGDKFDAFLDEVWKTMSAADKAVFINYPGVNGNTRAAADEYIAHLAENIDISESRWSKFTQLVKKFLKAIGIETKVTHADIANALKESFNRLLEGGDVVDAIEDALGEGTRFRFSKSPEEFDAIQKEAVEKKGIVMPGLNEAVLNVVDVPRHDFTGTGKDALKKAEKWANENIAKEHIYHEGLEDEFKYIIDEDAISKFLSQSSAKGSDNLGVHLAVLKKLPEVINNSIEVEIHPDYKKVDKVRSAENGVDKPDMLVHRLYAAVDIEGKVYRAKTTVHEFKNKQNKAYDYRITKVELIISGSSASNALNSSTSISATKVLNGVEKSYDKGKYLLDESEKTRFRFIGEKGAANLDKAEEATTRLDNLAVAREMESAEKDAKTIKMATGWERGADGLWRYEVADNLNFDYYANVDYRNRHPELARFEDLRKKLNSSLLMGTEALTEEEQKEFDALEKEFGGYKEYHNSRKLKDYLDAPELFDAYPELRNVELRFIDMDKGTLGKYLPGEKTIVLNNSMKLSGRLFNEQVLVHEIQHAIQHIEGFEPGANKNMQDPNKVAQKVHNREFMQKQLDKHIAERDELLKQKDVLNEKMAAWYDSHEEGSSFDDEMNEYNRQYDEIESKLEAVDRKVSWDEKWLDSTKKAKTELGEEGYAKVAGEVEARNVSRRMKMSDADRRNTLASETEDVAREDQIFLKDGIESGMRFRISDKARQLQDEADKFTSEFNSVPVRVVESGMSNKELEAAFDGDYSAKEIKEFMKMSKTAAAYDKEHDKILIFADRLKPERVEEALFHESIHAVFYHGRHNSLIGHFYEYGKDDEKFAKWKGITDNKEYKSYERPEEFFAYVVSNAMADNNLEDVLQYIENKSEFNELLNELGYDYVYRRGKVGRTGEQGTVRESDLQDVSSEKGREGKSDRRERAREIRRLFDQVADNGLRGVVGDKAYNTAMFEMYRSLPMEARERVAMDALNNHGADMGKAMDKFIGESYDTSLWDVVVGAIRNMLRKKGYDIRFSENDIRYLVWRNRQKLNRDSILDVAEDIDTRFRLKVGEYEGSPTDGGDTPDGGGTRFRTKKPEKIDIADERSEIIKSYDKVLKSKSFNFQEAFQDRMLSLKVLMEEIEKATGKKAKSFEDAYKAENQLGSVNRPMQIKWLDTFYKPLLEEMKKLSDKYGRENVERYIYCKSGLERNEVLRQRDADEAYNEAKEELDEKLANNEIDQAQYQVLLAEADKQRTKTLSTDTDYSGIRGLMFNTKADELFNQYKNGNISEAEYKKKVADLKKNEEQEIKDWKKFAEDQVQLIESKASKSELDALWGRINAATNETLRIDFESGMIDRETYEAEKNMMKYYVPLRNWENTTAEDMYEYRHDMTPAVTSNQQKAKGRKSQADNPIATIAIMAQNAIVRGNRNKMKMKLYSFVVNRPTDLASVRNVWYVRDANQQWVPQYADTSAATSEDEIKQIMEQFEIDMQKLEAQGDAYRGKLPFGMKYRANRSQKNDHVVPVMINGKEYAVYINGNPRAAQAVNGLTNAEGIDDAGKWIDAMKRWYGAGLTSWNPDFIIPNLVRDTIHASTMTFLDKGAVESAKYMWNVPKMFAQVAKEVAGLEGDPKLHQYFEEFVANGGETGYTAITTLDDYKKEYNKLINEAKGVKASVMKGGKEAISKIATILEAVNRIAEDTNRFNAYVTSRESGENIVNSIDAAKNITVNFNRKGALAANNTYFGKIASWMSRWILFFNPSVQGMYQIMTKSKANPKRATALGATILSTGFLAPMLNEMLVALFGDDEDDYWNQSDFKRRNNWMLFTGNGYVTIPLPPIFRELYGIGDIMYGVITGHITPQRAVYDVLKQVQSAVGMVNLLPEISHEPDMITYVKGFAPDLAAPILDVVSNTNFMGRPIAKWETWNESSAEYERVYKGVSPQWTELSKLINEAGGNETRRSDWWGNFINPAMMEHLFTSYGGGIGKTINNLAGMAIDAATGNTENMDVFRKAPIVPRFYTPTDEKSVYPGINRKYYEFEYQFNNASKSLKKAKDGVNSGEHPEWQKYIDEMGKNGESEFIKYFKKESKKLKKLQDKLKENPNDQEAEKKVYDKKAEIATESLKILKGDNK